MAALPRSRCTVCKPLSEVLAKSIQQAEELQHVRVVGLDLITTVWKGLVFQLWLIIRLPLIVLVFVFLGGVGWGGIRVHPVHV